MLKQLSFAGTEVVRLGMGWCAHKGMVLMCCMKVKAMEIVAVRHLDWGVNKEQGKFAVHKWKECEGNRLTLNSILANEHSPAFFLATIRFFV